MYISYINNAKHVYKNHHKIIINNTEIGIWKIDEYIKNNIFDYDYPCSTNYQASFLDKNNKHKLITSSTLKGLFLSLRKYGV